MKGIKVVLSICLSVAIALSVIGCAGRTGPDGLRPVDKTKTQISIANLYGGLGNQWLRQVADSFEAKHAETHFEDGKTGVQVYINDYTPAQMSGSSLLPRIEFSSDAIFLSENVSPKDFSASGSLMDITDIISTPLTEYGETESILQKMDPYLAQNIKTNDDKYYVLPWYEGFYQMYYDADLFDEYGFYFKADATADDLNISDLNVSIDHLFVGDSGAEKSVGPDMIPHTQDDGLPVTYKDFLALARYMSIDSAAGVIPVVWTGQYMIYMLGYCVSLWVNEEGYDDMLKLLKMEGELNELIEVSDTGEITELEPVQMSAENGSMFQKQRSRYDVLCFLEEFIRNVKNYDSLSFGGAYSHLDAQAKFLYSRADPNSSDIAILIEGSWWNNEASSTFNDMATDKGEQWSRQGRRIGVMPPLKSKRGDGSSTLVAMNDSFCCVNGNLTGGVKEAAKQFFRFMHTDEALTIYTKELGMTRAFDYTIEGEDYESMSFYAKSMYDLKKRSKVIYPESRVPLIYNNESFFDFNTFSFTTEYNNLSYSNPFSTFHDTNITAEKYFQGIYTSTQKRWSALA